MSDGGGWRDRLRARRDRLLSDPAIQRWVERQPLLRPLVRREARRLFDLVAGFVYTQVLLAVVRLRVLEALAAGPRTAAELAAEAGLAEEPASRLLDAAVAIGLLEERGGGRYGLATLGGAVLAHPELARLIEHDALLYRDLEDPVALLRGERPTALGSYWGYAGGARDTAAALAPDAVAPYSALMAASQPLVAREVLDAYPVARHARLLDVGGGEGVFAAHAAERAPRLAITLFDLPAVVERARARLAAAGVLARVTLVGGSFWDDPLPAGADLVTLVRVLFDHPDERVLALLARVRAAIAPGGTVLVAEPMARTAGAERMGAAYFGMYLLAMGGGRPRSAAEHVALLERAGFRRARPLAVHSPIQTGVVVAQA